jgi:aryl sulfotransferase
MLVKPARREYRSWAIDSRRWKDYRPRPDDIVIAAYPKCGTTWTQQIVSLLVFQTPNSKPVMQISPWIDRRFGEPIEAVLARIEAQEHRRFLKSHLPLDGLPFYDEVKYIHVARDGRDACISLHNHGMAHSAQVLGELDKIGLEDEKIGRPFPRLPECPAEFFHQWITAERFGKDVGPILSFFHFQAAWWEIRHRPNVLFVHFNDLKSDLSGEMRRMADFLGIVVPEDMWPELVAAADFDAMRRDGDTLMAAAASLFQGGSQRFFFKGTNERWRGIFRDEDLDLYDATVQAMLSPEWCQVGSRVIPRFRLATMRRNLPLTSRFIKL